MINEGALYTEFSIKQLVASVKTGRIRGEDRWLPTKEDKWGAWEETREGRSIATRDRPG